MAMPAGHAAAQQASVSTVETIVVTARRVEENLQVVPLTVNAFTAGALERQGVMNLSDISNLAPNVVWTSRGGTVALDSTITIRGIASNDSIAAFDPGVGFYVDDVYQASGSSFDNALLDISSVQVLKGPQGTLFGRNTTAGAVVITTQRPTASRPYFEADADLGNYSLRQFRDVANLPINDQLAFKVSGIYRERDGYERNIVTGSRDVNNEKHYGALAQLLYTPTPDVDILVRGNWYRDRAADNQPACFGAGILGNLCPEHPNLVSTLDHRVAANPPLASNRDMWGASVHGVWRAPAGFTFTSVTAYNHVKTSLLQDVDFVAADLDRSGGVLPNEWQVSQELRVASPQESRLRGVGGLYYIHEHKPVHIPLTLTPQLFAMLGLPTAPTSPYGSPQSTFTDAETDTDSYALFGQGQFDLTSDLTIEGGLRYTRDHKDFSYQETVPAALIPLIPLGLPTPVAPFSESHGWGATTGTASISYRTSEDTMTYLRYSRGYKAGGFNANTSGVNQNPRVPFNPEYVNSYEAGVKFETPDHRLRVNVAAFKIDYTDIQVQVTDPATRIKTIGNAAEAHSHGAEIEVSMVPIPNLVISANGGIQEAKFGKFGVGAASGLQGNYVPHAPPVTGAVDVSYSAPVGALGKGVASMTAVYGGGGDLDNANTVKEKTSVRLNARVGVESDRWGVYLWGDNLTDVARVIDYSPGLFSAGTTFVSAPRTFGVRLDVKY